MTKVRTLTIGILGLGTVGSGVWEILQNSRQRLAEQHCLNITVKKILVQSMDKPRAVHVPPELLTNQLDEILQDPEIEAIVELTSGAEPATTYLLKALDAGKHVITANKAALAKNGDQIFKAAATKGLNVFYEASVGGGIPIVRVIEESMTGNAIEEIEAILNGTTNFMLTKMARGDHDYTAALTLAQSLGYAEANPEADVDGWDAANKIVLLARLAFGQRFSIDDVDCTGIRGLQPQDFIRARTEGGRIKLIATAKRLHDRIVLKVAPTLLDLSNPLANVEGVDNAIRIRGSAIGKLFLSGPGAGALPTGGAVVSDLTVLAKRLA